MMEQGISLRKIANVTGGHRGRCLALILLVELLLAQFAIANPKLHEWMHNSQEGCQHHSCGSEEHSSDSQDAESHVCAVILISDGLFDDTHQSELIVSLSVKERSRNYTAIFIEPAASRQSARSPPQI